MKVDAILTQVHLLKRGDQIQIFGDYREVLTSEQSLVADDLWYLSVADPQHQIPFQAHVMKTTLFRTRPRPSRTYPEGTLVRENAGAYLLRTRTKDLWIYPSRAASMRTDATVAHAIECGALTLVHEPETEG